MAAQEIIPSGIAKDSTLQAIEALMEAQNATNEQIKALNDTMLYFITAVLEKMPRLDVNDRVAVNIETGTLPTLTTLTNMTNLNNLSGGNTNFLPYQFANIGANYIYDNIKVI